MPRRITLAALLLATSFGCKPQSDPPAKPAPASQPSTAKRPDSTSLIRFGIPDAPAKSPGAIRLAAYNLENLFDDKDDPTLSGENEDMASVKPAGQLAGLAAAIHHLDADILAVEEVESEEVLRWFRDTYLSDMGYTHLASLDAGDPRGIEQGVLSRYPIKSIKNWPRLPLEGTQPEKEGDRPNPLAGQPLTFHRSPLRVDIEVATQPPSDHRGAGVPAASTPSTDASSLPSPSATPITDATSQDAPSPSHPLTDSPLHPYTLTLFITHQKSGRYSAYWREAEAAGLAQLIADAEKENPNINIAALGDFNATSDDKPIRTLITSGLIDLFADLRAPANGPRDDRYITHESGRSIDFILVNKNLQPEIIARTRFVLGTPARPAFVDYRTAHPPPGYGSDHYPVAVDLNPTEAR